MDKSKPVLVTGAGGFIGSQLVETLVRAGFRVRAFVHYNAAGNWYHVERLGAEILREIEVIPGDIVDAQSVNGAVAGCGCVFHLAALIAIPYSYVAPMSFVSTNVHGTLNVLQACRSHGVGRLIHTSTSEVYGTAQYVPMDERHPLVAQSPYAASKIGADQLVESFFRSFGVPMSIVRPFNTFGPRQSARAVIPAIVSQALHGDTLRLGSLTPVRDLTFVDDTAAGFVAVAKSERTLGETVNLGVGVGVSIGELVEHIGRLLEKRLVVETDGARVRPESSEVMRLISDNRKVRRLTDWQPRISLEEGLRRVIEYVRASPTMYKADIYNI